MGPRQTLASWLGARLTRNHARPRRRASPPSPPSEGGEGRGEEGHHNLLPLLLRREERAGERRAITIYSLSSLRREERAGERRAITTPINTLEFRAAPDTLTS